ncbi:MAG: hypothetical protein AAGI03_01820 [Pseudomonadota bacterium]
MNSTLWVIGLVALGTALSARLAVIRYGWNELTYGGADPWAVLFYGLGGTAPALGIAVLVAGVRKLLVRSSSFFHAWVVTYVAASGVFACTTYRAATHLP